MAGINDLILSAHFLRALIDVSQKLPTFLPIISALSNGTLVTHKNSAGKNACAPLRGAYFYPFIRMSMAK